MRSLLVLLLALTVARAADAPFEILPGDRVLLLGDTLLEREGTYGYLETRMCEQFADRPFTVRNLSFAGDTPLGLSRAAFDPPAKGWERLLEQIALVRPTVVFLGYGMAASLQEITDRSQDPTLNRDPARYGEEPMSAARFKKELRELMTAISAAGEGKPRAKDAKDAKDETDKSSPSDPSRPLRPLRETSSVRFVLLSPIRHEDLRATRPGLPDPAEHNKLLAAYAQAIEELAKERGARFVDIARVSDLPFGIKHPATDNGIHLSSFGYQRAVRRFWEPPMGWLPPPPKDPNTPDGQRDNERSEALRAAIIAKNELFFHRWRPANSTYLTGFRKHEQGQNAKEMPMFDPLIEKAEAEIERLKKSTGVERPTSNVQRPTSKEEKTPPSASATSTLGVGRSALDVPSSPPPRPTFTVADGYQIELWAENPLLEKPTQMNWDALGRLWVCSSSLYPMIEPGQAADDKVLVLSDPEKTGKATKSEVFARGLLVPTGVVPDLEAKTEGGRMKDEGKAAAAPAGKDEKQNSDLHPSSFSPQPYGAYVGQSTELLHFAADGTKRIVLSGFGTEDTHHIVHTLRWGPDGRLYFNQSIYIHSHLETPWGLVRLNSGGCLAYDPRTERTEVFAKGWINSWGHAWDRWGQSFFTDGAGGGGINWAFPGAQFVTYEGARQTVPSVSPGAYPKFAGLEIIYSPHFPADWQGNAVTCDFRAHRIVRFSITDLTAEAQSPQRGAEGEEKIAGSPSPPNPSANLSKTSAPLRSNNPGATSSGYTTQEQPDLVRTADLSFRPIDVKLGPDGALYVADWSNPVINHGEVDFRDPRRDHHMGRIWRISKKGEPVVKWEPLVGKTNGEVLNKLISDSQWEKEQARRILRARDEFFAHTREKGESTGLENTASFSYRALAEWTDSQTADLGKIAALWTFDQLAYSPVSPTRYRYQAMGPAMDRLEAINRRLEGFLVNASSSADARMRAVVARELTVWANDRLDSDNDFDKADRAKVYALLVKLAADPNPRVRLEAMRALSRIPTARSAELVLDAALKAPEGDVFYHHAAWLSINDLAQPWLDALASGAWKAEGRERQLEFALNALPPAAARGALAQVLGTGPRDFAKGPWAELIGRAGDPAQLRQLFDALLVSFGMDCCPGDELKNIRALPIDDATALRCVSALLEAARVRNQRPTGDLLPLERLVFHTNAAVRAGILRLVGYWKPAPGLDWLRGVFSENALDPGSAAAAIESARDIGGAGASELLKRFCFPGTAAPTRQQAVVALASLGFTHNDNLVLVCDAISEAPNEDTALSTWRELFKIKGTVEAVEKLLASDPPLGISKPAATAGLRAAREAGKKGEGLAAVFAKITGLTAKPVLGPADFKAIAARMWTQGGDAAQGELIYRRATSGCVTCHAIGGAGGVVGPSLTSLGASAPLDYIIESLLVPNAKVKEGYNGVTLKLKDGSEITGIQARETAQEVILRNVAGQETAVVKANIAGKTDIGSIMPAGLLDALNDNQRMNLYAFLAELGKPGPFDASKANTARVWKLYPGTATDAALKGAPSDASANALTLVDGRLTKAQLTEALQLVTNPGPVIYAVTQFQSTGKTRLDLTGIAKAFLDGQPLTITADLVPELPAGLHTLAVKLDVPTLPEVLRAASPDASFVAN